MAPIEAFVGANGGGKTLAAVALVAVPALEAGVPVYSNFSIDHPLAYRLRGDWQEIDELRSCVLILDEITSVFPSRQHAALPAQLQRRLNQLRKVDVRTVWTAPNWQRADVILRECTQAVTVCRGRWADPFVRDRGRVVRDERGRRVRRDSLWPSNRLFRFKTYDAVDFENFTSQKIASLKPLRSRWYLRTRHDHCEMYDTQEGVDLMSHLDDFGACVVCGGARARAKCSCKGIPAEGAPRPQPGGVTKPPRLRVTQPGDLLPGGVL